MEGMVSDLQMAKEREKQFEGESGAGVPEPCTHRGVHTEACLCTQRMAGGLGWASGGAAASTQLLAALQAGWLRCR